MSIDALRTFVAWASVYAAFAVFLGYSAYLLYLDLKVGEYVRTELPPKSERWNPEYYKPGAEPWLARYRLWDRWRIAVWLGCIVVGNLLYWLLTA
ncbi:hypothetical protein [Longimicrobium sp.]|jgi:hypothetical protein|uniref:hypothetical protein n=1 Tax=Longimicrobium sp. TaxID=2029185 RepID=UPI002F93F62A